MCAHVSKSCTWVTAREHRAAQSASAWSPRTERDLKGIEFFATFDCSAAKWVPSESESERAREGGRERESQRKREGERREEREREKRGNRPVMVVIGPDIGPVMLQLSSVRIIENMHNPQQHRDRETNQQRVQRYIHPEEDLHRDQASR